MINAYLQVGIVAVIVGIIVTLITVLKKAFSLDRVVLILAVFLIGGGGLFFGLSSGEKTVSDDNVADQSAADRYFAAMYAEAGDYEDALSLLSASATLTDDMETQLLLARLSALCDRYSQSKLYYEEYLEKYDDEDVRDEAAFVSAYLGIYNASNNGAIKDYLEENGLSAFALGFDVGSDGTFETSFESEEEYEKEVLIRIEESAKAGITGGSLGKQIKETGEQLKLVNQCLYAYLTGESYDESELEEAAEVLNSALKGKSSLRANGNVRSAALVANALLGDAKLVASNIDGDANAYELAVATELYVNGYVDEESFKRLISDKPEKRVISMVCSRCKEIARANKKSLSSAEIEKYDAAIEILQSSDEDYILKTMLILMSKQADLQTHSQRSKTYLEVAKGFDYVNMDSMVTEYIDLALESASASDDSQYAASMLGLLSIISGESGEDVRNMSGYARDAISRLMPVPMEKFEQKYLENKEAESGYTRTASIHFEEEGDDFDFQTTLTDKVSQKKATINIGNIEKETFPIITTRLSFGTDSGITFDNIRDKINIYDCGYPVKTYEVNKIDNLTGKIILLCDLSGSMSGSEGDLRNAVISFADGMSTQEEVAVVGFSDSIQFQSDFMSDPQGVKEYAERIYAGGGTSVYPTIVAAADMFDDEVNDNNIIVVMTDGQDGARPSDTDLHNNIKKIVAEHNCTIYTVGLGDSVDTTYLSTIADLGNGQFLYVDSAESLSSFYEFMHAQITNSYVVTYEARDTVKNERELEVEYKDTIGSAKKTYYLNEEDANDYDSYTEDKFDVKNADGLSVYGFNTIYMYTSKSDVTLKIIGDNFKEDEEYDIKLEGTLRNYPITYSYVSDKELSVIVPYTIAVGTYTLKVSTDEESCTVEDALTVAVPGSLRQFKFGDYVFSCESAVVTDSGAFLHGNVTMNGWLHFKGDLVFDGDIRGEVSPYVTMTDNYGSYVKYSKNGSVGLAKLLATKGISIPLPQLGKVDIYSESYDQSGYKDFPVQKKVLNGFFNVNGLANIGGTLSLYPDMIYSEAIYSELKLPFLNDVLKNCDDEIFSHEMTGAMAITNTCFGISASYSVEYNDDNDESGNFQIGKMGFCFKKVEVSVDTIKEEYSVGAEVGFKAFNVGKNKCEGVGLELGWNGDGFDSFEISADVTRKLTNQPIPLYISGLSIGAENLSTVKSVRDLLGVKITGGFGLQTDDLIKYVPKDVKEFFDIDELHLAELDDAKISVTLADFNLSFETNVKVLGAKVGEGKIELGKIDYTNSVLSISETEYGADVSLRVTINPEWTNLEANLDGEARITLGYPFGGLTLKGDVGYEIRWFIFSSSKSLYGDFGIGVLWNSNNEIQFIVKAYGQNSKKKTIGFRIDVSKSKGVQKKKY